MNFFDTVEMAPPDPILGLNAAFKADPRSNKVNLSIGAYKTDDLQPLVLAAVRKAEQQILTEGMDKEYLSQDGNPEYVKRSIRLVFDTEQDNIFGAQAPGGTAGVRLAAEFLRPNRKPSYLHSGSNMGESQPSFHKGGFGGSLLSVLRCGAQRIH